MVRVSLEAVIIARGGTDQNASPGTAIQQARVYVYLGMARRIEFKRPQSAQPPDPLSSANPPPTQHTHPTLSIVATETILCTLKKAGTSPAQACCIQTRHLTSSS